jgi:hypothetical protein
MIPSIFMMGLLLLIHKMPCQLNIVYNCYYDQQVELWHIFNKNSLVSFDDDDDVNIYIYIYICVLTEEGTRWCLSVVFLITAST